MATKKLSRNFDIKDVFIILAFQLDHDPIVVSKAVAARTGKTATAKIVIGHLNALYKAREDGDIAPGSFNKISDGSGYHLTADAWIDWLDLYVADPKLWNWNDYRTKIASIAMTKDPDGVLRVTERDIPFMVGVPALVEQGKASETRKEEMKKLAENSEFVGTLKKREDFFFKVLRKVRKPTFSIYELIDRNGNLGMFFSSDTESLGLEENDCALIRMTPKEHEVSNYHGGRVTKFNRIKVLQNVGSK